MAFCVRCGKRIPEGIVFCPYCGTNLKEAVAGFEESKAPEQDTMQDFMQQRPTVEAQPLPQEQDFAQEQPAAEQQPQQEQPPVYTQPQQPVDPQPQQPPYQQPPYSQPGYGQYRQPPYSQPGYRAPFYTQKEDLGYLHIKKQAEEPARGLRILGQIFGILGMISSIIMMTTLLFLCTDYMGVSVSDFFVAFEERAVLLFLGVAESLALSLAGVLLSRAAKKKGNTSTAAGQRLGIVGLVLTAVNLADLILCLIVLLMG